VLTPTHETRKGDHHGSRRYPDLDSGDTFPTLEMLTVKHRRITVLKIFEPGWGVASSSSTARTGDRTACSSWLRSSARSTSSPRTGSGCDYAYEGAAWRSLTAWVRALRWQRLPAFDKVAQLLSRHLDGILAYCHVRVPFGKVEVINGNIRAMIRHGRGYRDHENPLLKVQKATAARRSGPWAA
jgi:Transposase